MKSVCTNATIIAELAEERCKAMFFKSRRLNIEAAVARCPMKIRSLSQLIIHAHCWIGHCSGF